MTPLTISDKDIQPFPKEWGNFKAYEVIASHEAVAGIPNDALRLQIATIIKYLGIIDQSADNANFIKKYKGGAFSNYQEYLAQNPNLTLAQYYNEVKERALQADTIERPTGQSDVVALYSRLINDFNLNELPEADREEVLLGVSKTIQKQFLLDVYDILGEEKFTALQTARNMGDEFYATTLKHLLPAYEEIFQASRMKVVTAFNK